MIHPDPERERAELREYLGDAYDHSRLMRSRQLLEQEAASLGDEATLYRTSQAYLYDLTAFATWETKHPYLDLIGRSVPAGASVLDYGCGIGSDGLALIEAGYRVSFADFDNPSTRYLRWRLKRRGLLADVYDIDSSPPPGGFDLVYCFDVIEHVNDPFALLSTLESQARLVLVNFLEDDPADTWLHRSLPIRELVRRAAELDLRSYRRLHDGRSHLVLYASEPAGGLARVRSKLLGEIGRRRR